MKTVQNNLPGIGRASHANLGVSWEKQIEATNGWYALRNAADVRKVPHNWTFISEQEYRKLQEKLPPSHLARTAEGKCLQRVKSDVDFTGGGRLAGDRKFAVCFDAKEVKGARFPLANVKPHQVDLLKKRARCGFVAGLLVYFSEHDRAFFVSADFLDRRYTAMLAQKKGRTAKPGTASLSISDLEEFCLEITREKTNGLWDWLPVVPVFI